MRTESGPPMPNVEGNAAPRSYRSIPIHAAPGLHEWLAQRLRSLSPGGRILELGSGAGALTARLRDMGFDVAPVDLDATKWALPEASLALQDLDAESWPALDALGGPSTWCSRWR
jgi:hypothetical protein